MGIVNLSDSHIYLVYMEGEDMIVRGKGVFHRLENAPGYLRDYIGTGCYVRGHFHERLFVIEEKTNGPG